MPDSAGCRGGIVDRRCDGALCGTGDRPDGNSQGRRRYVPLDPEYPQERLSYMLEDSGVRLLLTQAHLLDGLPVSAEVQPLVLAADSERLEGFDASDPEVAVTGENLAYVIYTSGSTGRPRRRQPTFGADQPALLDAGCLPTGW